MTVSQSLKKLVADGYIQRREHSEDTGMKTVYLTKKGKALASKLVPIVEKVDADFFDTISKQDQKILLSLLNDLVTNTEAHEEWTDALPKIYW